MKKLVVREARCLFFDSWCGQSTRLCLFDWWKNFILIDDAQSNKLEIEENNEARSSSGKPAEYEKIGTATAFVNLDFLLTLIYILIFSGVGPRRSLDEVSSIWLLTGYIGPFNLTLFGSGFRDMSLGSFNTRVFMYSLERLLSSHMCYKSSVYHKIASSPCIPLIIICISFCIRYNFKSFRLHPSHIHFLCLTYFTNITSVIT
jgi:hypothetical protein